jgi:signal peptidase
MALILNSQLILTKGDNNLLDDSLLYPDGQDYLDRHQIIGFVRGYVPFLGWIPILIQNPWRIRELASAILVGIGLNS